MPQTRFVLHIPGPHIDKDGALQMLEFGCIDADLVVQIKGRVACEMNSREELICTECLFENQLDDLEPEEVVSYVCLCISTEEPEEAEPILTFKNAFNKRFARFCNFKKKSLTKGFLLFLYLFNGLLFFIFV